MCIKKFRGKISHDITFEEGNGVELWIGGGEAGDKGGEKGVT